MDNYKIPELKKILHGKTLSDQGEMNRLHMQYAGIFKNDIPEFTEKLKVINKKITNFAR